VELRPPTAALRTVLDAMPGAVGEPLSIPRTAAPTALLYKIMGKMFAILSVRGDQFVIVKCDPHLIEALKSRYAGVGHRSHLDRRFWIAIDLDADVPGNEIERLVAHSYDQVRAGLTRKQQAALTALAEA
jgi:predicted DNA-binding protein (MmcQ/YjbR family)